MVELDEGRDLTYDKGLLKVKAIILSIPKPYRINILSKAEGEIYPCQVESFGGKDQVLWRTRRVVFVVIMTMNP